MKLLNRRQFSQWFGSTALIFIFASKWTHFALARQQVAKLARGRNKNFSEHEWKTIGEIANVIFPKTDFSPSATEAGVLVYLNRAFGEKLPRWKSFFRPKMNAAKSIGHARYVPYYRKLVVRLDEMSRSIAKNGFIAATPEQRDDVLRKFAEGSKSAVGYRVTGTPFLSEISDADLFSMIRRHVIEGYFSEPVHGGNKDFAGWEAIHNICNMSYPKEKSCPPHAI